VARPLDLEQRAFSAPAALRDERTARREGTADDLLAERGAPCRVFGTAAGAIARPREAPRCGTELSRPTV